MTLFRFSLRNSLTPSLAKHYCGAAGDVIRIQASDDVIVAGVRVVVLDEQGKALERGGALQEKEDWWDYVPREAGKVMVEARDLAGNKVKAELGRS